MGLFDGIGSLFNSTLGGQGSTPQEKAQDATVQQYLNGANANIDNSQDVQNGLINNAQQYRQNIAGSEDSAAGMGADQARQNFASKLRGNNSSAQSRGLLYSGIKQAGDQQAATDYATQLAAGRNQANNAVNQQANQLDQNAMSNGMQLYNQRQNLNDIQYNNMIQQRQFQEAQANGIAQGIGKIGGLIAGKGAS